MSVWSHDFWKKDPTIAPIRGALATFGLDVNDIGVASFHGTGTKANDYNESSAVNQQLQHLGRVQGNVLPCIFQKHLTGHPKGAAAAWMLNGVLQVLESGIIPGNRNCDNVEARLENFKFLLYPSKSIQTDGIKAALLKSFGFGQAGGEVLVIHPDYLYAALEENDFKSYLDRRTTRQVSSYRYFHEMFTGKSPFVKVKSAAPYADSQQSKVYLNPLARATYDSRSGSWNFNAGAVDTSAVDASVEATNLAKSVLAAAAASASHEKSSSSNVGQPADQRGIGLDVQMIADINDENEHFIDRNFTTEEIEYCRKQGSPRSSFAGRWAAKEAVIKALSSFSSSSSLWTGGAGAPLKEIEIVRLQGQAPVVKLHGDASKVSERGE